MADNRSLILSDLVAEYDFVVDDLSVWEIVNPSSEEEGNSDDDFSFSADEAEVEAVTEAESKESAAGAVKEDAPMEVGSPSSDVSMEELLSAQVNQLIDDGDGNANANANGSGVASVIITAVDDAVDCNGGVRGDAYDDSYAYNYHPEHNFYDSYAEYSEYSDAWDLENLGRNKNRKSGKKASSKMNKAKKLPCRYTKRCVYGKEGFGAQLSYL